MPESTLRETFNSVQSQVGFMLGYGRGALYGDAAWNSYQQASLDAFTKSGQRMVYDCGHKWHFLRPWAEILLLAGSRSVELPIDFGSKEGDVVVSDSSGSQVVTLPWVGEGLVERRIKDHPDTTGRPQFLCLEPVRGVEFARGQRMKIMVWPLPDADYTLTFPYYLCADATDGSLPFIYGGPQFSQLFRDAALAAAELDSDGFHGPRKAEFDKTLTQAIEIDRRNKAVILGRNTTRERWPGRARAMFGPHYGGVVTINGDVSGIP